MTPEPEWVDLGLPSGKLWRRFNLGADSPETIGLYFSWGNTDGHVEGSGYEFSNSVYNSSPGHSITQDLNETEDPASVLLGELAHTPSEDDFVELNSNCSSFWGTLNGVQGRLFKSNINGQILFFPAAGFYNGTTLQQKEVNGVYWSKTFESSTHARSLYTASSGVGPNSDSYRYYGLPVRAVREA